MKKAVIAILVVIVIILSLYWYSQQGSQTEKPNFDMNGTIEYIIFSCPFRAPCNPQYRLDAEDGNTYNLHFKPGARIPNWTQHIEVIGIETNQTDCFENYCENGTGLCKLIPCQPIGTVNVSNWRNMTTANISNLQIPNLTEEYLKTIIQHGLNLTEEQKSIIGIALSNQTVRDMVKEKEIKITSVSTVSYSNDNEGYTLPGVQIYISSDNWTSAREIIPLVDLKEKKVVSILNGSFVHPDMIKNLIS
jgi:hypothetical protein